MIYILLAAMIIAVGALTFFYLKTIKRQLTENEVEWCISVQLLLITLTLMCLLSFGLFYLTMLLSGMTFIELWHLSQEAKRLIAASWQVLLFSLVVIVCALSISYKLEKLKRASALIQ